MFVILDELNPTNESQKSYGKIAVNTDYVTCVCDVDNCCTIFLNDQKNTQIRVEGTVSEITRKLNVK